MQKKIIALAVAGLASTAAFAQSNVTIYGVADVGQAWVKSSDGAKGTNQSTVSRLDSNSSYIGFKGAEALGNGLTAVFQFETTVNADTGGFGGGRDTYAGLAGAFGTVAAGRLTHPLREMGVKVDILPGDAGIGTVNSVTGAINGIKTGADERASNAVAYISPTFGGGFSVTAAYVNGEYRTSGADSVKANAWQIAGKYDNGPLFVGLGYHKTKDSVRTGSADVAPSGGGFFGTDQLTSSSMDARVWRLAAVYTAPFGTRFSALYDDTKVENFPGAGGNDVKRAAWSLGAAHTFGANTVGLQYGRSGKTKVSGGASDLKDKASIWTLGYQYALSKRTMLQARYSYLSNDKEGNFNFYNNPVKNGAATGNDADYTGFMVGMRHTF
ncbi:MAG: porin [Azonexus sp.]|jgi:predicted porin|uniref:porin n=1 Tax=Azonexus sp. TaxID=1872668 RepID=UPI002827B260|nr:porin [Azonexus sp.]MDR0775635.1 porin [Azonexus sp.]